MSCCFNPAASDNKLLAKLQALTGDPNMLQKPLDIAFKHFDKDKSGYIEAHEVMAVAEKVCRAAGMAKAPTPAVNMIFDKLAGSDGRLDRQEFGQLLGKMFHLAQEQTKEKLAGGAAGVPTTLA